MHESRGNSRQIGSLIRWLCMALLVCAALFVFGRHLVTMQLDQQIRSHILTKLADHYPDMAVEIQAARRVEGRGIEIRGLTISSISEESEYRELVRVDEIFASCTTDLRELLTGTLAVRHLAVHRLRVRATRYPDGQWNVAQLLPLPRFGGQLPEASLQDSTVELRDLGKPAAGAWTLRDINIQLLPEATQGGLSRIRLAGKMLGDHFTDVQVQGQIVPEQGSWSAWGNLAGLEMSPRLLAALPTDFADYASLLTSLRARGHFEFQLGYQPEADTPLTYELRGQLTEGRLEDPRLPYPCTDLVANIHFTNQALKIDQVTARIGPSQLRLSCQCQDFLTDTAELQLNAQINQLPLNHQLFQALPLDFQDEWEKFNPSGTVDMSLTLHTQDGQLVPDLTVTCRDVSFAYHKFPYPLQHATGRIRYRDGVISFHDLTARAGRQTLHMAGQFENLGPESTGWFTLRAAGAVPIDDNLVAALKPAGQRIVRSLDASGMLTLVAGRIERTDAASPVTTRFELEVQNGTVQFDRFPYPIQKINGRLLLEDRSWQIGKLSGFHGSSHIECRGAWLPDLTAPQGGKLKLDFECSDVLLGDDLRNALARLDPDAQKLWDNLRPRGTIDHVSIGVAYTSRSRQTHFALEAEKWDPKQNIEGRSISLFPRWFPLRLDNVRGKVRFSDGHLQLAQIRGFHGETEIELAGQGHLTPDKHWSIQLTQLISDRIRIDHAVIDALPAAFRPALRKLDFRGPLSLNGTMSLRGSPETPLSGDWDILLDIENGAVASAIGIENVHGGLRLTGAKNEQGFASWGELEIDSMMWRGIQITQIQGPLWIDKDRLLLGAQAERGRDDRVPRQITARLMGGVVSWDMQMLWKENLPFAADLSLDNGDIRQIAQGLHAERQRASGRAFATMRIHGNAGGLHTLKGEGQVRLRQADIYELPVMVALLSFLSLRPADTTAFTSSDIDFHVDGAQLYFDRIDFSGDAISLKGEGWMDLNRQINLSFYALVGRHEFQVPIVSALLAEASRNILRIQVAGTVDQPSVQRKALPELDETLQRIFPEGTLQSSGSGAAWPLQQGRDPTVRNPRR